MEELRSCLKLWCVECGSKQTRRWKGTRKKKIMMWSKKLHIDKQNFMYIYMYIFAHTHT